MSRNFLSPKSQVELWGGGGGGYGIPDNTPPTTTSKIDKKLYKSKNSSNFLSPTSQEFSKSKSQVELLGGGGGGVWHARWPLSHH